MAYGGGAALAWGELEEGSTTKVEEVNMLYAKAMMTFA